MDKILFVSYDGYKTTNARVRSYRFSKELKKHGFETDVFSFKDHLNASYDGFESFKVGNLERISLLIRAIKRLLKEDKNTIFYVQKAGFFGLAPYFVHLVKGNRYILDYDDYEIEVSFLSSWLLKLLARNAEFCIAASHFLMRFLKKFNRKVHCVLTGVDTDVFKVPKRKKKVKSPIVFSWVGIIVDEEALKNVLFIVNNFKELVKKHNTRLEIVGGGEHMPKVEKLIKDINSKKIVFKGSLTPEEVSPYLDTVDVGMLILLKNTKYNQSKSPTKLFEYMAKGLACVSTSVGESKYVIKDGVNGVLVDSNNFNSQIEKMLSKPNNIAKLGKQARKTVEEKYNLEVLCSDLANYIKQNL